MDKRKTTLMGGSVLVLALVAALGIVYAAYSQSLTINGTANVKANSWDIHFTNLQPAKITGDAQEITAPTIKNNSTAIGDYSVLLSKPGDSIEYTFEVENGGTFPANLTDMIAQTPTCTGTGDNAEKDAENVCKYLKYFWSEENVKVGGSPYFDTTGAFFLEVYYDYCNGDFKCLLAEDPIDPLDNTYNHSFTLRLEYSDNVPADELPKNDVAISNLGASIVYTQAQ